jgi:HEAT repeat protein
MKDTPEALAELEAHYREAMRDGFSHLTFRGLLPTGEAVRLPLEQVYVDLQLVAEVPDTTDDFGVPERRLLHEAEQRGELAPEAARHLDALLYQRWRGEGALPRRQGLEVLSTQGEPPALVLLGDPGSGKSTLLHRLALRALRSGPSGQLPLFVPLAAYDEALRHTGEPLPLERFLSLYPARWRGLTGLEPLFQRALEEGRALVLLDGLDEVLDVETRRFVAQQVDALVRTWGARGNRFALTSRFIGYREVRLPGALPHFLVLDFGPEERERFAQRWCEAYEVWAADGQRSEAVLHEARRRAQELLADMRATSGVERLAANPLLLTLLALLRRRSGPLPLQRVTLYARYVHLLLEHWEHGRSEGARRLAAERLAPEGIEQHLMDLALWMQRHRPSGTARHADLLQALTQRSTRRPGVEPQEAERRAARVLQEVKDIAGLLGERGQDALGFLHLTFQEYFVGRALAREAPETRWELLRPHLHDARWREPLLLCAAWLAREGREEDFAELVRRLLEADSEFEDALHRDLFLAAAAGAEDVTRGANVLDPVLARLDTLCRSPHRSPRRQALFWIARWMYRGHVPAQERLLLALQDRQLQQETLEVLQTQREPSAPTRLREHVSALLETGDSSARMNAAEVLRPLVASDARARQALLEVLDGDDEHLRDQAASLLSTVADREESTLRHLLAQFVRDRVSPYTLGDLVARNAEVRAAFLTRLSDATAAQIQMEQVLRALGRVADRDEQVRDALLVQVTAEDGQHRCKSIEALASSVSRDRRVRDALLARSGDEEVEVRAAALKALGAVMQEDEQARRALLAGLDDEKPHVRASAIEGLGETVRHDEAVRQGVRARLADETDGVRRAAVVALSPLVDSDERVRLDFLTCMGDGDHHVAQDSTRALRGWAGRDERVREAFLARLHQEQRLSEGEILRTLGILARQDPRVRHALLAWLEREEPTLRRELASLFGPWAGQDERIHTTLRAWLEDEDERLRAAAVRALAAWSEREEEVRDALRARLSVERGEVQRALIRALLPSAPRDLRVRRALLEFQDADDEESLEDIAKVLQAFVEHEGEVRDTFLVRLEDEHPNVRAAAVLALGGASPHDTRVRRALLARLDGPDEVLRLRAAEALGMCAWPDVQLCRALLAHVDDPAYGMGGTIAQALRHAAGQHDETRQWLMARLDLDDGEEASNKRAWAAESLGLAVQRHLDVRQAFLERLEHEQEGQVLQSLLEGLAPLASRDPRVRGGLIAQLRHRDVYVRQKAVTALLPLLEQEEVRDALLPLLQDEHDVRAMGARLLIRPWGAVARHDARVRDALLTWLDTPERRFHTERVEAAQALGPSASLHPSVGRVLRARLDDADWSMRAMVLRQLLAHAPALLAADDPLEGWLGPVSDPINRHDQVILVREAVARHLAGLAAREEHRLERLRERLTHPEWSQREGAARALLALPGGPPPQLHSALHALLEDFRDEGDWLSRLSGVEVLLNGMEWSTSQKALEFALRALDHGTEPWYDGTLTGKVRARAAQALGQWEPLYRDERVVRRLLRLMREDAQEGARDAAYHAVLRLLAAPPVASA